MIDQIAAGYFSPGQPELFRPIVESLLLQDDYLVLTDHPEHLQDQERIAQAYRNAEDWSRMSIITVARIGKFSFDWTLQEYCQDVWHTHPVAIEVEA